MAETIGLIASVIQVAGAGLKLSQTLYQYADGVATADRRIKDIAKEIQLTSFVIEELGDVFKHNETSKLMSNNAVKTANETMKECSSVFAEIDATLKKSKKNTLGRLMLPFRDNKIELLRNHIDKLKSTLLLLMQVLSHAHQIASQKLDREAEAKQKAQIQELIELKKKSAKKYEESLKNFSVSDGDTLNDENDPTLDKTSSMNDSAPSLAFAAAAIGSSINSKTLETCVHHIRTLLEDIETLQQALSSQVEGSDHSEHHQSLIGSYFRARGHLDSVLFKGSNGPSASETSITATRDAPLDQSTANSTQGTRQTPIKIRDTLGRTYSMPFLSCSTWDGVHGRIKRIYEHVDDWRDDASKGHFDVLDSQGCTILPEDWEETVEPGTTFQIRFPAAGLNTSNHHTKEELLHSQQTVHGRSQSVCRKPRLDLSIPPSLNARPIVNDSNEIQPGIARPMPHALRLPLPTGHPMEATQSNSTNKYGMKGFRQRVASRGGTDPLKPKTMKRQSLKGLALSAPSPKQGAVYDDMERDAGDGSDVESVSGAEYRMAEEQEAEDEARRQSGGSGVFSSHTTVQSSQLPAKWRNEQGSPSDSEDVGASIDASMFGGLPAFGYGGSPSQRSSQLLSEPDGYDPIHPFPSFSSNDMCGTGRSEEASVRRRSYDTGSDRDSLQCGADAGIIHSNHNFEDPQLPTDFFEAPVYQPYNPDEEDRDENENSKKMVIVDDNDDEDLITRPTALKPNSGLDDIEESCTHEAQFGSLCVDCGEEISKGDYLTKDHKVDRATINVTHDKTAMIVRHSERVCAVDDIDFNLEEDFADDEEGLNELLSSATYIPDGESFGPGVGLPPLVTAVENKTTPAMSTALDNSLHRQSSVTISPATNSISKSRRRKSTLPASYIDPSDKIGLNLARNTLAARESRQRKFDHVSKLEKRNAELQDEVDALLREWTTVFGSA